MVPASDTPLERLARVSEAKFPTPLGRCRLSWLIALSQFRQWRLHPWRLGLGAFLGRTMSSRVSTQPVARGLIDCEQLWLVVRGEEGGEGWPGPRTHPEEVPLLRALKNFRVRFVSVSLA